MMGANVLGRHLRLATKPLLRCLFVASLGGGLIICPRQADLGVCFGRLCFRSPPDNYGLADSPLPQHQLLRN